MDTGISPIRCAHCVNNAPQYEISGIEYKCPGCEDLVCENCSTTTCMDRHYKICVCNNKYFPLSYCYCPKCSGPLIITTYQKHVRDLH